MDRIKVDAIGLDWPAPLVELKKALGNANTGDVIELAFTCPEAVTSLPGYCMKNNHEVLEFNKADKAGWVIVLKK